MLAVRRQCQGLPGQLRTLLFKDPIDTDPKSFVFKANLPRELSVRVVPGEVAHISTRPEAGTVVHVHRKPILNCRISGVTQASLFITDMT